MGQYKDIEKEIFDQYIGKFKRTKGYYVIIIAILLISLFFFSKFD